MSTNKIVTILYRRPKEYPDLRIKFLAIYKLQPNDLTDEQLKQIMQKAFLQAHLEWKIINVKVKDDA